MARFSLAEGTVTIGQRALGGGNAAGEDQIASVVFQIWSPAGGFSTLPKVTLEGSGQAAANVHYVNLLTGDTNDAGTAITTAGIYGVLAPGCVVQLVTSAGTAICEAFRVIGSLEVYHKQSGN